MPDTDSGTVKMASRMTGMSRRVPGAGAPGRSGADVIGDPALVEEVDDVAEHVERGVAADERVEVTVAGHLHVPDVQLGWRRFNTSWQISFESYQKRLSLPESSMSGVSKEPASSRAFFGSAS